MGRTGCNDMGDVPCSYQFGRFSEGKPVQSFSGIGNEKVAPDEAAHQALQSLLFTRGKSGMRDFCLVPVVQGKEINCFRPVHFNI